jgi:acyl-CoA synthetase (AMP-forming)/AMP-acid ligase II
MPRHVNALAEMITRAAERFAGRNALSCDGRQVTFEAVEAESNALASAMSTSLGLRKGDRVAVLLANCIESIVTDFALMKAGLVRVPVNPRYTAREVEYILRHSGTAAIVTGGAHAGLVGSIRSSLPELLHAILVGESAPAPFVEWSSIMRAGRPDPFAVATNDDDRYMIAYTSGTTGKPKGVVTTVSARLAGLLHTYANELFIVPDDAMLHAASLAHGSGTKVLPYFAKGARNVVMPKFDPLEFFRLVECERATTTWLVPTMIGMLVDAFDAKRSLSTLHTIFYAGSPMPRPLLRRAHETFGRVFVQIYGLTEAPQPDLILGKEDHREQITLDDAVPVPTGYAAVGVNVKIVNVAGEEVACGEIGELAVSGRHVLTEYWDDPSATSDTLRDGWCMTGDLARRDERGLHYVVGRRKDMIISGGFNVYPKEVEDVIYQLDAVSECAVIGEPDPIWGEIVHAFVACKPGFRLSEAALREHCKQQLADYKKPRRISLLAGLPLTANNKPDKQQLRAMLARTAEARDTSR